MNPAPYRALLLGMILLGAGANVPLAADPIPSGDPVYGKIVRILAEQLHREDATLSEGELIGETLEHSPGAVDLLLRSLVDAFGVPIDLLVQTNVLTVGDVYRAVRVALGVPAANQRLLLVVESSEFVAKQLRSLLMLGGYTVDAHPRTADEGIATYQKAVPPVQAVLMDLEFLPGTDPIAAIGLLRAQDPAVKIVVYARLGQTALVKRAMGAGANGYFWKPLDTLVVLDLLARVLE